MALFSKCVNQCKNVSFVWQSSRSILLSKASINTLNQQNQLIRLERRLKVDSGQDTRARARTHILLVRETSVTMQHIEEH